MLSYNESAERFFMRYNITCCILSIHIQMANVSLQATVVTKASAHNQIWIQITLAH